MRKSPMIAERFPGIMALPDDDKIQLAAELWFQVVDNDAADRPDLAALIEARLAEYQANPERVSPWAEVKARLLASSR